MELKEINGVKCQYSYKAFGLLSPQKSEATISPLTPYNS